MNKETDVRDAFVWTIYSPDGVHGVRCVYDKKSHWLSVERDNTGSNRYAATLSSARIAAREMAGEQFKRLAERTFLRDAQLLVERHIQ